MAQPQRQFGGKSQFPQRKKHILDDRKMTLTAEGVNGGTRPTLRITVVGNNPRFIVYTNVPNDKDNGKIQAELDGHAFYTVLQALQLVIDGKHDRLIMENKNFSWFGGKKSDAPSVQSKIVVGKDKDGCLYMSVLSKDQERPKIKFIFGLSWFHELIGPNGPVPPAEISVLAAKAWMEMAGELVSNVMTAEYVEPEKKDGGGQGGGSGGGGGGYGNYGGGGGGSAPKAGSSDFDDDLPM